MPFDNFFDKTDKRDIRFGIIGLGVGVLVVLLVFSYNYLTGAANKTINPPPENLTEPQRFLKAREICDEFPKPEQFERVNPQLPQYPNSSGRVYQGYRSERDFEEVIPTFIVWFEANGWHRTAEYDFKPPVETRQPSRQLIFSKENSTVTVIYYYPNQNGNNRSANYELSCYYEDNSKR